MLLIEAPATALFVTASGARDIISIFNFELIFSERAQAHNIKKKLISKKNVKRTF